MFLKVKKESVFMSYVFDVIKGSLHAMPVAYDAHRDMIKWGFMGIGAAAILIGSFICVAKKNYNVLQELQNVNIENKNEVEKNFLIYTIDMVALAVMSVLNLYITIPLSVGVPLLASVVFLPRLIANYVYPGKKQPSN